jgi:hypothetical protein
MAQKIRTGEKILWGYLVNTFIKRRLAKKETIIPAIKICQSIVPVLKLYGQVNKYQVTNEVKKSVILLIT